MQVPATQMTSMETGTVLGSERATMATASLHLVAGIPTHETRGEAAGPPGTGALHPATARITSEARLRTTRLRNTRRRMRTIAGSG